LKKILTKNIIIYFNRIIISACDAEKECPKKRLLTKNEIIVNDKKTRDEIVFNQLYQNPQYPIFGYKLRLHLYNLANLNPDLPTAKFDNNPGK
jgi:hypothetical protein